jgi:hypothetical protein
MIVALGVFVALLFAPAGGLADEVYAVIRIKRRHSNFGEVEVVRAIIETLLGFRIGSQDSLLLRRGLAQHVAEEPTNEKPPVTLTVDGKEVTVPAGTLIFCPSTSTSTLGSSAWNSTWGSTTPSIFEIAVLTSSALVRRTVRSLPYTRTTMGPMGCLTADLDEDEPDVQRWAGEYVERAQLAYGLST